MISLIAKSFTPVSAVAGAIVGLLKEFRADLKEPTLASNNRLAGFLFGMLPGAFGSVASVYLVLGTLWAIYSLAAGQYPWRLSALSRKVAVLLSSFSLALLVGALAGDMNVELLYKLPELLLFPSCWLLLVRFESGQGPDHLNAIVRGAAVGCLAAAVVAVCQFALGLRAEGGAGNANAFALIVTVQTTIALFGLSDPKAQFRQLAAAAAVAGAFCVALSGSRLGWVLFALVVLVAFYRIGVVSKHRLWKNSAIGLVMILCLGLFGLASNGHRIAAIGQDLQMIQILGDYNSSTGERIVYWISAANAFSASPIWGYGIQNRMDAVTNFAPDGYGYFITATHPHNAYLAAAVDAGVFGLAGLLFALLGPYLLLRRHVGAGNTSVEIVGCVALAYGLFGLNGNMFGHDLTGSVYVLSVVYLTAICAGQTRQWDKGP